LEVSLLNSVHSPLALPLDIGRPVLDSECQRLDDSFMQGVPSGWSMQCTIALLELQ